MASAREEGVTLRHGASHGSLQTLLHKFLKSIFELSPERGYFSGHLELGLLHVDEHPRRFFLLHLMLS